MAKEYEAHPVRELGGTFEPRSVERCEPEQAEYWSVYERDLADALPLWACIADFHGPDMEANAREFVAVKAETRPNHCPACNIASDDDCPGID